VKQAIVRRLRAAVPAGAVRTAWWFRERVGFPYRVPGERHTCPACDADAVEHLLPLPLHDRPAASRVGFVSGCRRCGILFANPPPAPEILDRMYSPDGRWGTTHRDDHREGQPSSRYLGRLFESAGVGLDIAHPPAGATVLDFGCGSGEILDALQEHGWTTYGIEPALKTAFARHRELEAIPASAMFDLAIAHHVLEHVSSPLAILRALAGSLKPAGLVLVSVPRLDGLSEHRDYRYCLNGRAHIVSYTADAMATLMGMSGLEAMRLHAGGAHGQGWRGVKRLVMLGRKNGTPTSVENPLQAALRAVEAWRALDPSAAALQPGMPVRTAAAVMNFQRNR
jgi:SAM-dependent methyltransferase